MNAFISNLYPERRGLSVNLFHIAWNVGSTIGPSLAAFLIVTTGNWRNAYLFPLPVLFSVSVLMVLFSRSVTHVPSAGARPRNPASVSLGLLVKFLPVAMIAFFYVAVEMGLSTWLAYILENLGSAALEAGLATGLFWGLMGVGRLVWAPIVDRTGYVKPLIAASGLALICMVSASLPLPLGLKMLLWASSGLFLAPMFPTLIAWVVSLAPELGGSLSGLVFTLATIGLFFSNSLVGMVAATFSVEIAQYVFVFFAVAMLVNILAVHLSERQGS